MSERAPDVVVVVGEGPPARGGWGVTLALGIVAVAFGIIVLANIWGSVRLVAILAGLFLLFAGVMQLAGAFRGRRRAGRVAAGVLVVLLGVVLIAWPESSVKTVAVLVGLAFLLWGAVVAIAAAVDRVEGWGVAVAFGALLAVVGLVVIVWPGPTVAVLMILIGVDAVLFGVSLIAQALRLRRA